MATREFFEFGKSNKKAYEASDLIFQDWWMPRIFSFRFFIFLNYVVE
jgi:hypothetical protein